MCSFYFSAHILLNKLFWTIYSLPGIALTPEDTEMKNAQSCPSGNTEALQIVYEFQSIWGKSP